MASAKLIPQNPEEVMVIRDLNPSITTLSVPFLRFGTIKFGGRATIVKLTSGSLAVFSPVALTPTVKQKLNSMGGDVRYIAAPDLEHHIFLSSWATAFPSAQVIGPEGLPEKRAEQHKTNPEVTEVKFQTVFTAQNKASVKISGEFDQDFEYEYLPAHPNKEIVFFHKPTATLIEADLLFNMPATEQYSRTGEDARSGAATKLFGALQGAQGSALWQKRMLWYVFSKSDRAGFSESIRRIDGWGIKNIIPCHGDTIEGNGTEIWRRVMGWHLEGKK
ncbi:hypothetical protein BP5796_09564 [Coleophoma crateriformis]|uniref:Metallo-beta-lactamase domain-containing protein n=1 Tax=Coleophoma crateriformis TaxID=565419 RepID=A0A3D8QYH6_9HELO|nr:hypothetical protein BP5796_09564 [Coleophoma crateriformis]